MGSPPREGRSRYEDDSERTELATKIKTLQRENDQTKQQWWSYCEAEGGGYRDPNRHPVEFLRRFFEMRSSGTLPQVQAISPSMNDADPEMHDILVRRVKQAQRSSEQTKFRWWSFCDAHNGGVRDPVRHDSASLKRFFDEEHGVATGGGGGGGGWGAGPAAQQWPQQPQQPQWGDQQAFDAQAQAQAHAQAQWYQMYHQQLAQYGQLTGMYQQQQLQQMGQMHAQMPGQLMGQMPLQMPGQMQGAPAGMFPADPSGLQPPQLPPGMQGGNMMLGDGHAAGGAAAEPRTTNGHRSERSPSHRSRRSSRSRKSRTRKSKSRSRVRKRPRSSSSSSSSSKDKRKRRRKSSR